MELREMVSERLSDTEYPILRNADSGELFRRIGVSIPSFFFKSLDIKRKQRQSTQSGRYIQRENRSFDHKILE
jgi:hypothetical protein